MRRRLLLVLVLFAAPMVFAADEEAPTPQAAGGSVTGAGGGPTQLFQIILVRGSAAGPEEIVGIPANAAKAIRDIRDFLPFRSYRILDSGLLRGGEGPAKLRVDGVAPQQYDVSIVWQRLSPGKLLIRRFVVHAVRRPGTAPLPRGVAPQAERPVIDTSFSVDVGETIVVGSSKLGGSEALLVLLTAMPNR